MEGVMATSSERLMEWLRDAHAMEGQSEQMLHSAAGRLEHYPDLRSQFEKHRQESIRQEERLRRCIDRRGGKTSTIKDTAAKLFAFAQGASGLFVGDEVVKATLAVDTFEHMEIASYKILIAAAQAVGDSETLSVCEESLREEEAMAEWLEQNIDSVTQRYLAREETPGATAKH
jgi:ferritin-like metal-binding protein YciE